MKKANFITAMAMAVVLVFGTVTANAQIRGLGQKAKEAASQAAGNAVSKAIADKVTFKSFPKSLEDFQAFQAEYGKTPEGAIAVQLVAMEMYRHDKKVGQQCLALCNTQTNLSSVTSRLNELYREGDSYARPYLVSAMLLGAKPSNSYNPNKPFTIRLRLDPTKNTERSQMLKGYVTHLQLYSDGYDTPWRSIDVVLQQGDEYYRISNCPAILTQCKEIDFDATDTWHELK
jgi:hypothetical protein